MPDTVVMTDTRTGVKIELPAFPRWWIITTRLWAWLLSSFLLLTVTIQAQEPVARVPDIISWGTAAVNPTVAILDALKSSQKACRLRQVGLSQAIGMGTAFTLQRFIVSPRPCLGCDQHGNPSAHVTQSVIGATVAAQRFSWGFSIGFALGTAEGRDLAHRHNRKQEAAGLALGALADVAGQRLIHCS